MQNTLPPRPGPARGSAPQGSRQQGNASSNASPSSAPTSNASTSNASPSNASSPALSMAKRIRNEQGLEQAKRYLVAMEPFLVPAERAHMAEELGVSESDLQNIRQENLHSQARFNQPPQYPQYPPQQPFNPFQMPGFQQQPQMNGAMQLMGLLSGFNQPQGSGLGGGMGGMDQMALMQLLGGMMGKK